MNVLTSFKPNSQSAELVQPADGSFDDPAFRTKAAAMFAIAFRNERFGADLSQCVTVWFRVICSISVQLVKAIARRTGLTRDRWHIVDQRQQLRNVMPVGAGETRSDRQSSSVGQQVMLRARLSAVYRAGTRRFAPRTRKSSSLLKAGEGTRTLNIQLGRHSKPRTEHVRKPLLGHTLAHFPQFASPRISSRFLAF